MLHRNQTGSVVNASTMIMDVLQKLGISADEQAVWRVALSRANPEQLSDVYQSLKTQPSSVKILTQELLKASKDSSRA